MEFIQKMYVLCLNRPKKSSFGYAVGFSKRPCGVLGEGGGVCFKTATSNIDFIKFGCKYFASMSYRGAVMKDLVKKIYT